MDRIAQQQHDTLEGAPEPSENPLLVGHVEAAHQLVTAHATGKLAHGIILSGPRGIGKATLAFHFANSIIDPRHPAIGQLDVNSPVFRQIAMGAHPAVLHLTRPQNDKGNGFKTMLTVDEVRKVNRFLSMTAHDGAWRVVIVDPVDDLNRNAANALLKNLEEPPARTLFILVAHSLGAVLPTIRSRAQVIKLQPLGSDEMVAALANIDELPLPEGEGAQALAERSGGSVRRAILLVEHGGLEIAAAVDELAATMDIANAYKLAEAVSGRDKAIPFEIFNERVLELLSSSALEAAGGNDLNRANRLSDAWHEARAAIIATTTYNLDQKQHTLNMISKLNSALRM